MCVLIKNGKERGSTISMKPALKFRFLWFHQELHTLNLAAPNNEVRIQMKRHIN